LRRLRQGELCTHHDDTKRKSGGENCAGGQGREGGDGAAEKNARNIENEFHFHAHVDSVSAPMGALQLHASRLLVI
jgi:hypothetical protein